MKRAAVYAGLLAAFLLLAGCVEGESELTINADGSGSLRYRLDMIPQAVEVLEEMSSAPGFVSDFPWPLTPEAVRAAIQKAGLVAQEVESEGLPDGGLRLDLTLSFDHIGEFVQAGPFRQTTFQLSPIADGDVVYTGAVDFAPQTGGGIGALLFEEQRGRVGFAMARFLYRGMRFSDTVTLPGPILETNGERIGPRTVRWQFDLDALTFEEAQEGQRAVIPGDSLEFGLPVGRRVEAEGEEARGRVQFQEVQIPEAEGGGAYKLGVNSTEVEMKLVPSSGEREGRVKVRIGVVPPEGIDLAECRDAELEPVLTGDGQLLRPRVAPWLSSHVFRDETSYEVTLNLEGLRRQPETLVALKGELIFVESTGTKDVRIGPLEDWVGKRLEHPDLEGLQIYLDRITESSVDVRMTKSTERLIRNVSFLDASGRLIHHSGASGSGGRTYWEYEYRVQADPGGTMVLKVHRRPELRRIPIHLSDIPLP